jgi:flagellar motor protein MotB
MKLVKRRESPPEHVDTEGSWAVSYGDMITLLLSFFVLFFSVDHEKTRKKGLEQSLILSLAPPPPEAGRGPNSVEGKEVEGSAGQKGAGGMQAATEKGAGDKEHLAEKDKSGKTNQDGHSVTDVEAELLEKWDAKVYKVGTKVIVDFPGTSFFNLGDIEPNSSGGKVLTEFAKKYLPFAGSYVLGVRAFTDERKVRQIKSRRYNDNLELSALRSIATMRILEREGLPISRMRIGGWGVLKLREKDLAGIPPDSTLREKHALSRKVIFVIEADEGDS